MGGGGLSDPDAGDVNKFSTEFFGDWFGDFDGQDIYAILAASRHKLEDL